MAYRVALLLAVSATVTTSIGQSNPLEPTHFGAPASRQAPLPPPLPDSEASRILRVISSDGFERSADGVWVTGLNIHFEYAGYRVFAERAEGNIETERFSLAGGVQLVGATQVIAGETVLVDFRARTFQFDDGSAQFKEQFFQGRLLSDLYLRATSVQANESIVICYNCQLTTCNRHAGQEHFTLDSDQVRIIPDKRLEFRNLKLRINGRTLATLPSFVIPLDREYDRLLPETGQSTEEGLYARFRYGFPIGEDAATAKVSLTTQRGISTGLDFLYNSPSSSGEFRSVINFQQGGTAPGINMTYNHSQSLPWGSITASHELRRFSYLTGLQNQSNATRITVTPNAGRQGRMFLNFDRRENSSTFSSNIQESLRFADTRTWSPRLRTQTTVTAVRTSAISGGQTVSERELIDTKVVATYDSGMGTAELDFQRNLPIGSNANFIGGIERIPELRFRTSPELLFGNPKLAGIDLVFSAGSFRDNFAKRELERYFFEARTRKNERVSNSVSYNYDLRFTQGVYSDDTAQFTPAAAGSITYRPTTRTHATVRYNYRRQHGFTPLSFDRSGQFHVASFDGMLDLGAGLSIGGQTGFDANRGGPNNSPWQPPGIRLEYAPSSSFVFRGFTGYLPNRNRWGNSRFDLRWGTGGLFVGAAARYDGIRNVWGNANLIVDGISWGKMKMSFLLRWNGYLERFDARHLSFAYDLHDAEAILQILETKTGFRPGTQVVFLIRLKALPFSSPFGIGNSGQPLDLGTGGF